MRFVVLSDTHIPRYQREIPSLILKEIERSDGVIALGDFTNLETVLFLERSSKRFFGVHGNMDDYDVKEYLSFKKIVVLEGLTLGLCHGWGPPSDIRERIYDVFQEKPKLILYGHTHTPDLSEFRGVSFLNPGTATKGGTFGILDLKDGEYNFQVVEIPE
ncbi:MAG: YfcE family phosphodiesterase [Thermotogae bacterium]|nr:YfcE family phosphodiesterase [Thermotogota bacterium]